MSERQLEEIGSNGFGILNNNEDNMIENNLTGSYQDDSFQAGQENVNNTSLNASKYSLNDEAVEEKLPTITNEFKVILLGDCSVGKTSIFNKFTIGQYSELYRCTVNVEFKTKILRLDKFSNAKLTIWDTMGSEKFRAITRQYFRDTNGIILIFDLTQRETFTNLTKWINDIKDEADKNVEVVLVGNKSDLESNRKVDFIEAQHFADNYGYQYIEASAKDGTNIWLIFEDLSRAMNKHADVKNEELIISQSYVKRRLEITRKLKEEKKVGCC